MTGWVRLSGCNLRGQIKIPHLFLHTHTVRQCIPVTCCPPPIDSTLAFQIATPCTSLGAITVNPGIDDK